MKNTQQMTFRPSGIESCDTQDTSGPIAGFICGAGTLGVADHAL